MRLLPLLVMLLCLAPRAEAGEPLKVDDVPEFYQRIITLPDAALYAEPFDTKQAPGAKPKAAPPIFSVLYVYGRRKFGDTDWLAVSARASGDPQGWMQASATQNWRTMLVMQFAPRGQRERVLIYRERDTLQKLVRAADAKKLAQAQLSAVVAGRGDLSALNGVEPAEAIDYAKAPYLMPILDWKVEEFEDGTRTTLTQVASVTTEQNQAPRGDKAKPAEQKAAADKPPAAENLKDFKIGVVFAIDTTMSMGPYIERTRETIRRIYADIEKDGNLGSVAFGLVGYRNNIQRDPRVEYVTHVFQPLDVQAAPAEILQGLDKIREAKAPTPGWDEDAYAALYEAMTQMDWSPFAARFVVLITDAGALNGKSPLARYRNVDTPNIVELAGRKNISILPVHLKTPEAARFNNHDRAANQYRELGRTGDRNVNKYFAVEAGAVETFGKAIDDFANVVRASIAAAAKGALKPSATPSTAPTPTRTPTSPTPPPVTGETALGKALVNEIFRARIEYIGATQGAQAPQVLFGWTADKDLINPRFTALDVKVFLTRNQLNGLAQSLSGIVEQAKRASLAPETFFDLLQSLSATMAADPGRTAAAGQFANLAESKLLPSYLKALPYRSKILRVTKQSWIDLGLTGQQEFIDELEYKLKLYQDMYQDTPSWIDFGAKDPGLAAYPVPLEALP